MAQVWRALAHFDDVHGHLHALHVAAIEPTEVRLSDPCEFRGHIIDETCACHEREALGHGISHVGHAVAAL